MDGMKEFFEHFDTKKIESGVIDWDDYESKLIHDGKLFDEDRANNFSVDRKYNLFYRLKVSPEEGKNLARFETFESWSLDFNTGYRFSTFRGDQGIMLLCKKRDDKSKSKFIYLANFNTHHEQELISSFNNILKLQEIILLYRKPENEDEEELNYKLVIFVYEQSQEEYNPEKKYVTYAEGLELKDGI